MCCLSTALRVVTWPWLVIRNRSTKTIVAMLACEVWSRWTYPLPNYSILLLIHYLFTLRCELDFWPCDFDLWPLTLNICSVSLMTWWNYVPNLNAIEQSMVELLWFQHLTLWPWSCVTCCPRLWNYFNQLRFTFDSLSVPELYRFWCWYVMSRCDLEFWTVNLKSSW